MKNQKINTERKYIITSESVNIGHPDKTCDYIADAFLDEALSQDPNSQMAVECSIKNDKLFIYGEATTKAKIDYEKIAKEILKEIGYTQDFEIIKEISIQSPDINQAVVKEELCANDQGIVFGYATNESKEYMPLPIMISHKIMREYENFRKKNNDMFFADAKCQTSIEYINDKPSRIDTILLSCSHSEQISIEQIQQKIKQEVLDKVLLDYQEYGKDCKFIINPSGKFTIWGSYGDSGCVGRKIVVDTYGGVGRVGGGCFSSKNATKVDRSGAYYARYVAKNIVAHKFANRCEIQISYGIGLKYPISIYIDTFGTEYKSMEDIYNYVFTNFDFSVGNMIKELDLLKPIYKKTACYGHFGRDGFSWEKIKNTTK
ncbi:MAG: methionine adenosyltransferase [Clostridia bacterium]|nr:methionine adenosyltransferase [Clostridia bacterium]